MKLYGIKITKDYGEYLLVIRAENPREAKKIAQQRYHYSWEIKQSKLLKVDGKSGLVMEGGMEE